MCIYKKSSKQLTPSLVRMKSESYEAPSINQFDYYAIFLKREFTLKNMAVYCDKSSVYISLMTLSLIFRWCRNIIYLFSIETTS